MFFAWLPRKNLVGVPPIQVARLLFRSPIFEKLSTTPRGFFQNAARLEGVSMLRTRSRPPRKEMLLYWDGARKPEPRQACATIGFKIPFSRPLPAHQKCAFRRCQWQGLRLGQGRVTKWEMPPYRFRDPLRSMYQPIAPKISNWGVEGRVTRSLRPKASAVRET